MDHFSSKNNGVCPALKVPLFQPALLSVPSLIILSPTSTSFSEAQLNQSICGSCHETGFSTFFHIPCSIPACFSFHHHWQKNCFGAAGEVSSMTFNRNYITTSFPAGNTFPKTYLGLKPPSYTHSTLSVYNKLGKLSPFHPLQAPKETNKVSKRFAQSDFLNKGLITNSLFPFEEVLKLLAIKFSFCAPQARNMKFCYTRTGQT